MDKKPKDLQPSAGFPLTIVQSFFPLHQESNESPLPKISEVLNEYQLPPLQQKVYGYLQEHKDEVFSYMDSVELGKLVKHTGSQRGIAFSLWDLNQKGLIEKERLGRRVYFGSKEAIAELRKRKKK